MQQENFSGDNSGRFASGQVQNPQYVLSSDEQNIQGMVGAMQHSPISVTSQPPPYPGTTPLPSMTRTFSQQMQQSQFSPRVAYQNPQQQYQSQQTYVASGQGVGGMSSLSPGAMSVQQGMSVSPGASGLPRKSLAGMMSPIRAQPMNMPPPSPPVVMPNRMQGPISPLSVYMSQAQSPQRRTPHVQSMQPRAYPPPHSPIYPHQPMSYSYGPQAQVPQTSPVPSPRYVDPSQHSQMSSLLPSQGHLHSPQSVGTPGIPIQRSPYKAARQLNMAASPNKIQAYPPAGGMQQWQYSSTSTSQEMWDKVPASPVIPSLPVLSAETLDLLSTLTVSTTTSSMQSSTVSNVSEAHMQKSPLLQQHLLMPAKPIRPSGEGNLLAVSTQATAALTPTTPQISKAVVQQQIACTEVPPSRSDLKRSDRQTTISSSIEKSLIYKSNKQTSSATSACVSTTNTLTTSIVTSLCKIEDPKQRDNMTTQASTDGLALVSAVENTVVETPVPVQNPAPMDVTMTVPEEPEGAEAAAPPSIPQEILEKRAQLCEVYRTKLQEKLSLYKECLTELFFLKHGGNFMDYVQFKKRPSNKLLEHLKTMMPDSGQGDKKSRKISHESTTSNGEAMSPASDTSNKSGRRTPLDDVRKPTRLRSVSHEANSEKPQSSVLKSRSQSQEKSFTSQPTLTKSVMSPSNQVNHVSLKGQSSPLRLKRLAKQTLPASLDESIGSQEEILERAKQEAVIQRKVVELRKQGLWTQRRLPKVQEPPRNKTHWDYLLEEMRWLAADFAQERKWKRAAARKLVRAVVGHHKEQHDMARRAKREEQNRLRRIASTMAREIRIFWGNIGKVVEYKQRSLLDEKRQKALDLHLSYIVDQTEKYSDWLTQGLNKPQGSVGSSPARSLTSSKTGSDDDFLPQGESSDDEETIAVAEQDFQKADNTEDELSLLKQESQLPFDELLDSLPQELIENIGKPLEEPKKELEEMETKVEEPSTSEKSEPLAVTEREDGSDSDEEAGSSKPTSISLRRSARKRKIESSESTSKDDSDPAKKVKIEEDDGDKEFTASQEDSAGDDDEATMEEEEDKESADHKKEIDDLQAEGEMPIEDLMKMYGDAFNQDPDQEDKPDEEDDDNEEESKDLDEKEESSSEDDEEEDPGEEEEEIGMDYLLKADFTKDDNAPMIVPAETPTEDSKDGEKKEGEGSPSKEITDVAAEAASLQPTGFTLATTQVVTPIPVLLKHTLREYQHIGLDWLVTMYDKRLNGILADEMGLGKTIQTIALLAHLACDKGVWGPHLIVVPTSVMLNWEMEFKKWCPGFKILTYYGSQKERKAKRTGWTKSNAFHVCITSYKLVLQDNVSFRRKKWKYLVLDEAQNIKNFKSQRWQTLLNFNSQRRLLLTGTPLQNNLMELWSLMHFLMPHVFQSHKEFKEWFSNPLTGMIEGSQDYNEKLVRRLHKVLRPFLLRRIKKDVEKQMPNKYEHVIRCHLSKRQRFLYDDFMAQASTKDTLESGHFMSVINILMQLRKVCNHPNLFEPRPIVSPFLSDRIVFNAPSLVTKALEKDPFKTLNLQDYHLHLPSLTNIHQSHAERVKQIRVQRKLIEEMDEGGNTPPERSAFPKYINIREHLGNLIKDRERLKLRNVATLNISQQSLQLLHHGQQTNTLPVLTIPITSGTGGIQISNSAGTTIIPSRVITIPQSKADDTTSGRTNASQSFTLQYQTLQGTRVAIPNKIRQLPGGVVQIMAPGAAVKAQASATQPVSLPVSSQETVHQNGTIAKDQKPEPMEVDKKASKRKTQKLDVKHPTSYLERLEQELLKEHKERCLRMASVNETRCEARPDWMARDTIDFLTDIFKPVEKKCTQNGVISSNALAGIIKSNKVLCKDMKPVTDRFVFVIPKVEAKSIGFHVSHPSPSVKAKNDQLMDTVEIELKKEVAPLHSVNLAMRITFPEARLIQYDCGKLQILNVLLRRFWAEKHKCLIFTQMTKVLDILEAFLSYHGYRYLRLDGSTRVEQRMLLMERFNQDPKIFCFILSTRSGGIGVNLTGADTVIFYDSDWNPTMDAQAQDRCHRIGQTRDVHIYRLISERTVEENILKKANQKRLLGDLAIEGGSFTTAFFKEQAIKDLFNEPSGLEDLPSVVEKEEKPTEEKQAIVPLSKPITARQKAIAAAKEVESKPMNVDSEAKPLESKASSGNTWEDALQQTEDKEDVDAAKQLKEEQDADMEEFTENAEGDETMEGSRVHEEMKSIYEELTPIEKYALRYLEETTEEINREELELAEEEVHKSKQDWEIAHLVALKEEEERRLEEEEDEIFYTREDAENQVNDGKKGGKKRKRKKERDICFLDMSSTSSEEENDGIDVETLENEDNIYEDIKNRQYEEVNISPRKNKVKTKVKTPPKKKPARSKILQSKGRGGARSGQVHPRLMRIDSPHFMSPSRRKASVLAYDITTHGYHQDEDFLFYNEEEYEDSFCGEEAPWDEELPWSEREDWPDTPSEDNYSSDDFDSDDRTVCILTDGTPRKEGHSSSLWQEGLQTAAGGRGQHHSKKTPLYNVVVETNVTPTKLFQKPQAQKKRQVNIESFTQRVNQAINLNTPTTVIPQVVGHKPITQNVIPTISLKPRAPRPQTPTIKPVLAPIRPAVNVAQIQLISARPVVSMQPQPQVLNAIFEQQAAQRQKLSSYKIPKTGKAAPPRCQASNILTQPRMFQIGGKAVSGTTATIIPLTKFGTTINLAPVRPTRPQKMITVAGNSALTQQKPLSSTVMVPMSALSVPQQTYFIQQSRSGQPIQIIPSSSVVTKAKIQAPRVTGNVLRTNTGVNVQPATPKPAAKRKATSKVSETRYIAPKTQKKVSPVSNKKPAEVERGIFDIVSSMEFMAPPLPDPDQGTPTPEKGSLFDSLEQEFLSGGTDDDGMITLDLEPVSPSDPQLFDPSAPLDNEEERNVFESFQSLLQQ